VHGRQKCLRTSGTTDDAAATAADADDADAAMRFFADSASCLHHWDHDE